jgi:hypothetical protein
MGVEMKTFAASTLDFREAGFPSNDVKPAAVKIPLWTGYRYIRNGGDIYGLSLMTDWRPDAQTQKVLFLTRLQRVPAGRGTAEH